VHAPLDLGADDTLAHAQALICLQTYQPSEIMKDGSRLGGFYTSFTPPIRIFASFLSCRAYCFSMFDHPWRFL
jgi:hypothetical protein